MLLSSLLAKLSTAPQLFGCEVESPACLPHSVSKGEQRNKGSNPPGEIITLRSLRFFTLKFRRVTISVNPKPTPLNPSPAICHKRQKSRCNFRKVALQKLHCNIRFSSRFDQKLRCNKPKMCCNIEKAALPLSCGFQAPTSRNPRSRPADHPKGTTLREALRGNLPRRGLCEGLFEGSAGLCGFLRGSMGFSEGSDPMLVTLRNCWILKPLKTLTSSK